MKNLNYLNMRNLIILSFVFLLFSSCNTEEVSIETLENQTLTFDEFFQKVSEMNIQTSKENSIFID